MLEKQDLKQIENIIDKSLDNKLQPINQELSGLKLTMEENFTHFLGEFAEVRSELDEICKDISKLEKLETEDLGAAFQDIEIAKKRLDAVEERLFAHAI